MGMHSPLGSIQSSAGKSFLGWNLVWPSGKRRIFCHSKNHSQPFLTKEIWCQSHDSTYHLNNFNWKSMAASVFCDDRKSALRRCDWNAEIPGSDSVDRTVFNIHRSTQPSIPFQVGSGSEYPGYLFQNVNYRGIQAAGTHQPNSCPSTNLLVNK